jgi:hypothetical protein
VVDPGAQAELHRALHDLVAEAARDQRLGVLIPGEWRPTGDLHAVEHGQVRRRGLQGLEHTHGLRDQRRRDADVLLDEHQRGVLDGEADDVGGPQRGQHLADEVHLADAGVGPCTPRRAPA